MDAQNEKSKNKQKDAKTLTTEMQNMSMQGKKRGKNRKFVVKTSLENPFALDWPVVSDIHQQEIIQLIKDSFANMKKDKSSKPPWSEVRKFKGRERRQFMEEHKQNHLEQLSKDPTAVEQRKQLVEDWAHIIVGYNAVMRGVEQKKLAGVLVKKDAQPPFLTKAFLPGCANNGIPLVPIVELDTLLRDESTLGLPHSCLVVGLRLTAANDGCRFFNLVTKMCEALNMDTEDSVHTDDSESNISESDNISDEEHDKENQVKRKNAFKMSEVEMSKYYLKRTDKKKRIFTPGEDTNKDKQIDDGLGFGSNFISLGGTEVDIPDEPTSLTLVDRGSSKLENKQKSKEVTDIPDKDREENSDKIIFDSNVDVTTMDSDNFFVVDSGGDDFFIDTGAADCDKNVSDSIKLEIAENNKEEECKQIEAAQNFNQKKRKKKEKPPPDEPPYIPAKVKRIKGNPNKKVGTNDK